MTLEQIQAIVADDLHAVEKEMHIAMQSDVPLVRDVSQHILQGGKRIRPLLSLLIGHLLGHTSKQQIFLGCILEFIHTATLLHDDVVDNSTMRRGIATANDVWGNEASVLVGDFLYSRAFQLLVDMADHDLMAILAKTMNVMAEGEVLQLMSRHDINLDEAIYFRIINAKTAVLFQAACEMAATLATTDTETIQCAANFGKHIGLAFQLVDDALDYQGDATELGKNIGDDLAEGKVTLPLIHALRHANAEEKQLLGHIIATGELVRLEEVQAIIARHQSVAYTLHLAKQHEQQAIQSLDKFSGSIYKTTLIQLAEFILIRSY
ncbi:MAG: polyprenyl synthetase family protein [Pseudomonadota bacterium]